jgi:RNA recognition motif-containing protein
MNNSKNATVYISNLSYTRDRNGLKSMFLKYGKIKNIKIIVEPSTNQSRGMAFVEMSSAAEAKKAIEGLDQQNFDGRTVKAKYATPLKDTSISRLPAKKVDNSDLDYVSKQLAKKARNDAKRKSNPLKFKLPTT